MQQPLETWGMDTTSRAERYYARNQSPSLFKFCISVFFLILSLLAICLSFWRPCCRRRRNAQRAGRAGSHNTSPKKPYWMLQLQPCSIMTTKIEERIKLHTKPYTKKFDGRSGAPFEEVGTRHVQTVLNDIFNETERRRFATLRNDTCIVQIAMRDFTCGRAHYDFIPADIKGGNFSYQMFGEDVIQATWFHTDTLHVLAGICIFLETPYIEPTCFSRHLLYRFFVHEPNLFPEPRPYPLYQEVNVDKEAVTESLISHFCKQLKQPVMLGREAGEIVHMEWDAAHKTFQYCYCDRCKKDLEQTDEPPSYYNATQQLISEN